MLQRRTKGAEGNPRRTGFAAGDGSGPPLWLVAELRLSSSRMTASLPGTAVSPAAVNRPNRLWVRRSRNRVIQVDVIVRGEVRIERDAEQAAFTGGIDREGSRMAC